MNGFLQLFALVGVMNQCAGKFVSKLARSAGVIAGVVRSVGRNVNSSRIHVAEPNDARKKVFCREGKFRFQMLMLVIVLLVTVAASSEALAQSPPTGVSASDGTYTYKVGITWNSASLAFEYQAYRATSSGGAKTALGWRPERSYNDTSATPGRTYWYWVKARTIFGTTGYSSYNTGWRKLLAPTGVSASNGTYTYKVFITWNSVSGAGYYQVYRATTSGGTPIALSGWQTGRSYNDTSATPGVMYWYWVRAAVSSSGYRTSGYSSYKTGWRKLLAPTGVLASDGTYTDKVYITWNTVADVSYYKIYRAESSGGTKTALSGWETGTSYNDTSATPGRTYYYWVRAANPISGGYIISDYSSYNTGLRKLSVPTGVSASDGTYTDRVYITWNSVTGASYYRVYRAESSGGTTTALGSWQTGTTYNDTSATPGVLYRYWVKAAISSSGSWTSDYSLYNTGWRRVAPPTGVSASDGTYTDRVRIIWNSVPDVSHYQVYRSESPEGAKTDLGSWQTGTSYDDTSATRGTTYYYWVRGGNPIPGGYTISGYSSYNTGWRKLSAPTGVSASDGTYTGTVRITWSSVSGASHYRVYRAGSAGGTKTALSSWQTGRSYNDTSATPGTTYYYWAEAATSVVGDRASGYSSYNTGWRQLLAPTGVSGSDGTHTDKVGITWNGVWGASYYHVYRAASPEGTRIALGGWQAGTSYDDTTATSDYKYYYYWVKAAVSSGGSRASEYSSYNSGWQARSSGGPLWYVDVAATGTNDGTSWTNAYNYLQDALAKVGVGDEIRVAEGTYRPDEGSGVTSGDRDASFHLRNDVAIYGGFPSGGAEWEERNAIRCETILNGDLNGDDFPPYDFSQLDSVDIAGMEQELSTEQIAGSDGMEFWPRTYFIYQTNLGRYGKFIVEDFDSTSNNRLTIAWVTYNSGGSVYSSGSGLEIRGTYPCDLDEGQEDGASGAARDWYWRQATSTTRFLIPLNGARFKLIYRGSYGEFGDNTDNSYHVVMGYGIDENTILDGFTITAGNANASGMPHDAGGGMRNQSGNPTVRNCTFTGNSAIWGGGIENFESSPVIDNCTFSGNFAGNGGGVNNYNSNMLLTNCTFSGNSATRGGGMYSRNSSSPTITNCRFSGNSAGIHGGGMYNIANSNPTITNCTFGGNTAGSYGGGMLNAESSSPILTNCILWGNSDSGGIDESAQIYNDSSTPVINYCCVQGWTGGLGGTWNIGDDPVFVDADGADDIVGTEDDNLRLSEGSSCIDAGDNTAVGVEVETDLDGHPRIIDGDCNDTAIVDMGAYEFNYAYMGDFDYNCEVNFGDFAILGLAWVTEPRDENWNQFCDISIPADNYIDWLDLGVFADNWLADF